MYHLKFTFESFKQILVFNINIKYMLIYNPTQDPVDFNVI